MIYLDYAATAPLRDVAINAMRPFLHDQFGNASSIYGLGRKARSAVDAARHALAQFVECQDDEIVFTSGGTESIHSAFIGAWLAQPQKRHVITTTVEHHAVLHTSELLEELGVAVTKVNTDRYGRVDVDEVLSAVRPDTLLVSVMSVNNELGSINSVSELTRAVHALYPDVLVHSDMVQAAGAYRLNLTSSGVDLATFTAHKLGGPKGVGALYIRKGTHWKSVLRGGAQERERRAGTENVAAIAGFGAAVQWLDEHFEEHLEIVQARSHALKRGLCAIPGIVWNSPEDAVAHIVNVQFQGLRADRLLMRLDLEGVAASAGSACAAGSISPSHVLLALGLTPDEARQSVRFSLSDITTEEEVSRALEIVQQTVERLRSGSR